jgi:hypothetical protein
MRTKSSRLFLVLLHLVSVSTDIGGVNTNPRAILLERIQLQKDRLEGFIQHEGDDALAMPFWLQVSYSRLYVSYCCVVLCCVVLCCVVLCCHVNAHTHPLSLPLNPYLLRTMSMVYV